MQVELVPLYCCVAGLDVHLNKVVVCIIRAAEGAAPEVLIREFGGFKRDRCAMAEWIAGFAPEAVSMESTGIYWKSPYAALERVGIRAKVVNARHVAKVEGRKTDICDAQGWPCHPRRAAARELHRSRVRAASAPDRALPRSLGDHDGGREKR